MAGKVGEDGWEVEEMLSEYRSRHHINTVPPTPEADQYIDYKNFVAMLQN